MYRVIPQLQERWKVTPLPVKNAIKVISQSPIAVANQQFQQRVAKPIMKAVVYNPNAQPQNGITRKWFPQSPLYDVADIANTTDPQQRLEKQKQLGMSMAVAGVTGGVSASIKPIRITSKVIDAEPIKVISQPKALIKAVPQSDLIKTEPVLNMKRAVPIKDIHGQKSVIPEGEALTPYELKGNKVLLKDGEEYIVNKNQYQNIKGQAVKAEAKEFAPELKGTEETVKGDMGYAEQVRKKQGIPSGEEVNVQLPKYSQYTLPGGENYREVLIKAPETKLPTVIEKRPGLLQDADANGRIPMTVDVPITKNAPTFKSSHWDEPNVISHLRLNDRTYNGKKVTFMEEMQSDWAREGRSKGFADKIPEIKIEPVGNGKYSVYDTAYPNNRSEAVSLERANELKKNLQLPENIQKGVPNNPLLKNWQELSIKRGLKDAVDNGSDYFAWTTGEQQQARYNLSKQVDNIKWWDSINNTKGYQIKPKNQEPIQFFSDSNGRIMDLSGNRNMPQEWVGKNVTDVVGKGIGEKMAKDKSGTLAEEGLNIGGEWANALYDRQVKNIVEDVTGGKVETVDLGLPVGIDEHRGNWFVRPQGGQSAFTLTKDNLKKALGKVVQLEGEYPPANEDFRVTKILGGGKFEAVPANSYSSYGVNNNPDKQIFDINPPKSSGQQSIRLTPEIKAKIMGQAPQLKQPSGKSPFYKAVPK